MHTCIATSLHEVGNIGCGIHLIQAIENQSPKKMKDSIQDMQCHAGTLPGKESFLDVCYLRCDSSLHYQGVRLFSYMTLLAYAAMNGQKDMVQVLIANGASRSSLLSVPKNYYSNCYQVPKWVMVSRDHH